MSTAEKDREIRLRELRVSQLAQVIALAAVIGGLGLQAWSMRQQAKLKEYEVTFLEKRDNYAKLLRGISRNAWVASNRDIHLNSPSPEFSHFLAMQEARNEVELTAYAIEPFLSEGDRTTHRYWIGDTFFPLSKKLGAAPDDQKAPLIDQHGKKMLEFATWLYPKLFDEPPPR